MREGRTSSVEEVGAVLARERDALRELAHELDDLRDVVVVLAVLGPGLRIEKVIPAGQELEYLVRFISFARLIHRKSTYHTCRAPHVCAGTPFGT